MMPSPILVQKAREPTAKCPNCGALVPPALPVCFMCDQDMPSHPVEVMVGQSVVAEQPPKAEVETAEEAFKKLEEDMPLEEELLPEAEKKAEAAITEDKIVDLMLDFERGVAPSSSRTVKEIAAGVSEGAGEVEEAKLITVDIAVSGERKSYRGFAIASAGGFLYVLGFILVIPLLGSLVGAMLLLPGSLMIVGGANLALKDTAAYEKSRQFACPLCGHKLDISAKECGNCGAMFSEGTQ